MSSGEGLLAAAASAANSEVAEGRDERIASGGGVLGPTWNSTGAFSC